MKYIDNLINISDKHFVIISYNNIKDLVDESIISKFKNVVEISESTLIVTCNNILKTLPLYSKRDLADLFYNMNKEYYNIKVRN